jgi:hypothetical protein
MSTYDMANVVVTLASAFVALAGFCAERFGLHQLAPDTFVK